MNEPSPILDALVEQGVRPRVEYLSGVIAQMIQGDPKDPRVLRCVASIQSQAFSYLPNPIATRLGLVSKLTPRDIEKIVDHIGTFSIAGVRAIGQSIASQKM
ncbi:MAG: CerR family C-terminal domain-containing protein, partial [Vicinamibacteria bacterium]